MAAHSRALARKIPLTEEPGGLQSMGSQVLDMTEVTEHAHVACRLLVPWPATRPVPPEVEAWSPNLWTTREVLLFFFSGCIVFHCKMYYHAFTQSFIGEHSKYFLYFAITNNTVINIHVISPTCIF